MKDKVELELYRNDVQNFLLKESFRICKQHRQRTRVTFPRSNFLRNLLDPTPKKSKKFLVAAEIVRNWIENVEPEKGSWPDSGLPPSKLCGDAKEPSDCFANLIDNAIVLRLQKKLFEILVNQETDIYDYGIARAISDTLDYHGACTVPAGAEELYRSKRRGDELTVASVTDAIDWQLLIVSGRIEDKGGKIHAYLSDVLAAASDQITPGSPLKAFITNTLNVVRRNQPALDRSEALRQRLAQ